MNDRKILLVDDEEKILSIFSKQLINLGHFNVETAQGGVIALEKLKANKYDLMLLDLMMADKDGVQVLTEMKDFADKPKVIVLTNLVSEEQKQKTKELGVVDYLIKTEVEPANLIAKINQLLGDGVSEK